MSEERQRIRTLMDLLTAPTRRRMRWLRQPDGGRPQLGLGDASSVAVIGSGPAGSLFSYFLLEFADRAGIGLEVDLYEPRVFDQAGPPGCNMCGGLISETLVQNLATEGLPLSSSVVQRGIDSYVLHTDVGSVRIETPARELRIAAVHRGAGPRGLAAPSWPSFDKHLQTLAIGRGARLIRARVDEVSRCDGRPTIVARDRGTRTYDLLAVAAGVNSKLLKALEGLEIGYHRPQLTKTLIREYYLGQDTINRYLGTSMHVFLPDIPRLEFAALIPKGDYVTMCLLGDNIDNALGDAFAASLEVRRCMPPGWEPDSATCRCLPHINIRAAARPFGDRVVFIGDAGVTRLYKDGIGAAYRTAKAAARVAVFEGISAEAFRRHYMPVCRSITWDNRIGRVAFGLTRIARQVRPLRRLIIRVILREQATPGSPRRMSGVLWDIFSGSAPYSDILRRMIAPRLLLEMLRATPSSLRRFPARQSSKVQ